MADEGLASFLGKRLSRARQAIYTFQGPSNQGPIELQFNDGSCLVLDVEMDGQSVSVGYEALAFHMPQNGNVVWEQNEVETDGFIGTPVTRIDAFVEKFVGGEFIAAWRIWFGSSFLCYANVGDTSVIAVNENPPSFQEGWVTVCDDSHALPQIVEHAP